jgi:hypothetical protein
VVRSKIGQPSKNPARRKSDWELGLCHQIISAITIVMLASIGIVIVSIVIATTTMAAAAAEPTGARCSSLAVFGPPTRYRDSH